MQKKKIAVLGPECSYTDLAYKRAKRAFSTQADEAILYSSTISAVFSAVASGKVEYGIVPWKNSSSGVIRESAMNFAKFKVKENSRSLPIKIHKRFWMKISHVLAVFPNTHEQDIDAIMTNRVIFAQCRKFLKKHFSKARKLFSRTSSAAAAFLAKTEKNGMAVIVPREAAKHYGLKIISRHIEDSSTNFTEFVIFSLLAA